jgi:heme/copper-type cytochrome/quinol oxidase subunit 4
MDLTTLILQHISFVAWTAFVIWYGVRIQWERSEYGINTFITGLSLALALTLIEVSILFENDPWRPVARIVVYALIAAAGVQRLYFMARRKNKGTREVRNGNRR